MIRLLTVIILENFLHASEIVLPKPIGPHEIGVENLEISDPSRTMLRGEKKRRWMITLFYPSIPHKGTYPYMPGTLDDGKVDGVKVMSFSKPKAAPLLKKYPTIFFLPGRGNERQKYTILCGNLASFGYIVIAMDQPYGANFVKFPKDEKFVLTFKDAWNLPRDRDYRYAYDDLFIEGAIKDIDYVLKNFPEEFKNICDLNFVILMGHSLGGNVAHIMGFKDQRIKAIVDVDSKITERKVYGAIGVPPNSHNKPVLFIRGQMQYQEDVGGQLEKINNATIWKPYVEHSAFSDDAYFKEKIPNYGEENFIKGLWNWLFKKGPFFSKVDTNLGGKKVEAWFKEYTEYVVRWLENLKI